MRITEVHFEGPTQIFAVARRKRGAEYIEVEIVRPTGTKKHMVQADDKGDLWSMAECLQEDLEGRKGAGGDVRAYFLPLELMSDL